VAPKIRWEQRTSSPAAQSVKIHQQVRRVSKRQFPGLCIPIAIGQCGVIGLPSTRTSQPILASILVNSIIDQLHNWSIRLEKISPLFGDCNSKASKGILGPCTVRKLLFHELIRVNLAFEMLPSAPPAAFLGANRCCRTRQPWLLDVAIKANLIKMPLPNVLILDHQVSHPYHSCFTTRPRTVRRIRHAWYIWLSREKSRCSFFIWPRHQLKRHA
jgi:hypothetical protein